MTLLTVWGADGANCSLSKQPDENIRKTSSFMFYVFNTLIQAIVTFKKNPIICLRFPIKDFTDMIVQKLLYKLQLSWKTHIFLFTQANDRGMHTWKGWTLVFPLETINVSKQRSPYIVFKEYLTGADGLAQWTKCSAQEWTPEHTRESCTQWCISAPQS